MSSFSDNFAEAVRSQRGRPKRPTVKTNIRIPVSVYDEFCRQALTKRVSLHKVLQQALIREATVASRRVES